MGYAFKYIVSITMVIEYKGGIKMGIFDGMKKFKKQMTLNNNKFKGRMAENNYELGRKMQGYEVKRTGRGSDYKERKVDVFTGKKELWTHVEVKSNSRAPLSKLQRETKKKTKRYRVHRQGAWF